MKSMQRKMELSQGGWTTRKALIQAPPWVLAASCTFVGLEPDHAAEAEITAIRGAAPSQPFLELGTSARKTIVY